MPCFIDSPKYSRLNRSCLQTLRFQVYVVAKMQNHALCLCSSQCKACRLCKAHHGDLSVKARTGGSTQCLVNIHNLQLMLKESSQRQSGAMHSLQYMHCMGILHCNVYNIHCILSQQCTKYVEIWLLTRQCMKHLQFTLSDIQQTVSGWKMCKCAHAHFF